MPQHTEHTGKHPGGQKATGVRVKQGQDSSLLILQETLRLWSASLSDFSECCGVVSNHLLAGPGCLEQGTTRTK